MDAALPLTPGALFPLGAVHITVGASQALMDLTLLPQTLLARHQRGDWGNLGNEDKEANDQAVKVGARILSKYNEEGGVSFYVITGEDRSITTILLPDEY